MVAGLEAAGWLVDLVEVVAGLEAAGWVVDVVEVLAGLEPAGWVLCSWHLWPCQWWPSLCSAGLPPTWPDAPWPLLELWPSWWALMWE